MRGNKNKGDDIFVAKTTFFNINSSFRKVCGVTPDCVLWGVSSTLRHTEVRLSCSIEARQNHMTKCEDCWLMWFCYFQEEASKGRCMAPHPPLLPFHEEITSPDGAAKYGRASSTWSLRSLVEDDCLAESLGTSMDVAWMRINFAMPCSETLDCLLSQHNPPYLDWYSWVFFFNFKSKKYFFNLA